MNHVMKTISVNEIPNWELSFYTAAFPYREGKFFFPRREVLARIKTLHQADIRNLGFDGIHLLSQFTFSVEKAVKEIKVWLDDMEMCLSSLHFAGPVFASLQENQDVVKFNMRNFVDIFHKWKPKVLVIHSGWINLDDGVSDQSLRSAYKEEVKKHGEDTVIKTIAENLKDMAKAAKKHGIKLAMENMGKLFPLGSRKNLPQLIRLIDEPNVGYCIDSGHAHACGESVTEWIRFAGNRLFETHFHDNRGESDEHLPVGFGTIPWLDVIAALREINFKGPVTFEASGWPDKNHVKGYKNAIAWWRTAENMVTKKHGK